MASDQHALTEEAVRRLILDRDWTEADLQEAAKLLEHVQSSPDALAALRDYDLLRAALRPSEADAGVQPPCGWDALKPTGTARPSWVRRWSLPAAAACLAVVAVVWIVHDGREEAPPNVRQVVNTVPSRIAPPDEEQDQARLFQQVSSVFDGQASWLALTDEDSQLGLTAEPVMDATHLLLLRLTVTRSGDVVSQVDVAILPGQSAELDVPFNNGQRLIYNIDTSADTTSTLSVWAQLDDGSGDCRTLAALMTQLRAVADSGRVEGQLSSRRGTYEFKVDFSQEAIQGPR